jgi:McrBC 5-methylcytosine restriction system component
MARVKETITPGHVWSRSERSSLTIPAGAFIVQYPGRGAEPLEIELAESFVRFNQSRLDLFNCTAKIVISEARQVSVRINTGICIGALPLKAPSNGKLDLGLCITPKSGWDGLGALLSDSQTLISPQLPRIGVLPKSDSQTPTWVISAVVLKRLELFVLTLPKAFNALLTQSTQPTGSIVWNRYIQQSLSIGRPDRLIIKQSVFQYRTHILSLLHATANQHIQALSKHGRRFERLLQRFEKIRHLSKSAPQSWAPLNETIANARDEVSLEALDAMRWTRDNTGLGGIQAQKGLAWKLNMEQIFEAWVATVVTEVGRRCGGRSKVGALRQTLKPIVWQQTTRTQNSLIPDVELETHQATLIVDAKYKDHWNAFHTGWHSSDVVVKENHRNDLLQVLAYAASHSSPRKVCVLVYPCSKAEWEERFKNNQLFLKANVAPGNQVGVELVLTAIPFGVCAKDLANAWSGLITHDVDTSDLI